MEHEIKITITHKFSDTDLDDLMTTALEGGITYWCDNVRIKEGSMSEEDYDKVEFISDVISKGGVLILTDAESDETWELDHDKLLKGIQKYCEERNVSPNDLMNNYDANDADTIVQFAVFNELTFS